MESQKNVRLQAAIHGRVQGVGFRYFVLDQANLLGITGWTRNRLNRTVEVAAEGKKAILEEFLEVLHQGPPASGVTHINREWLSPTGEFTKFRIRMTR